MTNVEKAREYLLKEHLSPLNNILHQCDLKTEMQYHKDIENAFIKGAEWKDEQHKQEKQQLIENVYKWLEENAHKFVCTKPYPYDFTTTKTSSLYCGYANKALIDNLKKAIEK